MKKILSILLLAAALPLFPGCRQPASSLPAEPADENPVIEAIMARRSIRQYTDRPVPRELLQKLAECGVNAPNAMNRQEWEVRIIDRPEFFSGVTDVMKAEMPMLVQEDDPSFRNAFRNATAAIAVACPDSPSGMTLINVGLLCENICLAAQSLGLGSVVMAGPAMFLATNPAAEPYLAKLGFSEGYKLRIVVGIGYPDEAPEARPRDLGKIRFID